MLWSFPASSLPLFTSPPLHSAALPTSIAQGRDVGGCPTVSHPRLDGVFCRFWAEHWFRLGGAGWADFLLLWHARWPGPGCCRRRACCYGFHGGDPGGAAVRWPLEAVSWHWDWDDHHQSGQVRTRSFERPHLKNGGQSRSCSTSSFHLLVVGSTGEAKVTCTHAFASGHLDEAILCFLWLCYFFQGPLKLHSPLSSQTFLPTHVFQLILEIHGT